MKIVVGYDGSEASQRALNLAIDHAKVFKGEIHVLESFVGGHRESLKELEKGRADLDYARKTCEGAGVPCDIHQLVRGLEPGEDIVLFAEENKADEVVMAVERTSKVEKLLLGSIAQYVILHAPCPVVTIR